MRNFQESIKFQVCFKEVSGVCREHVKGESRKFSGVFLGWFQKSFNAVSKEFPKGFKEVPGCFLIV